MAPFTGDGGNLEGLYQQFAAVNCSCPLGSSALVCPCANYNGGAINPNPTFCQTNEVFNTGGPAVAAPVNGTQPD